MMMMKAKKMKMTLMVTSEKIIVLMVTAVLDAIF